MHHFCLTPLLEFGTGAGLIIAIGAQNAFVLKQGILKTMSLLPSSSALSSMRF